MLRGVGRQVRQVEHGALGVADAAQHRVGHAAVTEAAPLAQKLADVEVLDIVSVHALGLAGPSAAPVIWKWRRLLLRSLHRVAEVGLRSTTDAKTMTGTHESINPRASECAVELSPRAAKEMTMEKAKDMPNHTKYVKGVLDRVARVRVKELEVLGRALVDGDDIPERRGKRRGRRADPIAEGLEVSALSVRQRLVGELAHERDGGEYPRGQDLEGADHVVILRGRAAVSIAAVEGEGKRPLGIGPLVALRGALPESPFRDGGVVLCERLLDIVVALVEVGGCGSECDP
ncbi:hypothetical protein PG987_010615 [Apiospora arundinis]